MPTAGMSEQIAPMTPKTTGRRKGRDPERNSDERALDERGHDVAVYDGAGDLGDVVPQPALALFVQGNEGHPALDDLFAVLEEEVQHEEHQEEPHEGAERAEEHELAVGERELERRAQPVDDPRLDLVDRHRSVVGEPVNDAVHEGKADDVARPRDPVAVRERAEPVDEVGCLSRERDRDEGAPE